MFETSEVTTRHPAHRQGILMCCALKMRASRKLTVSTVLQDAANTFHVAILFCNVSCVVQMSLV